MKTDSTENMLVGSRTTEKHGDGGNEETENNSGRKQKSILVIEEMPTECIECQFCRILADDKPTETRCILTAKRNEDGVNTRAEWCPLKPLPEKMIAEMVMGNKFAEGCVHGWNDCIDAITGETE